MCRKFGKHFKQINDLAKLAVRKNTSLILTPFARSTELAIELGVIKSSIRQPKELKKPTRTEIYRNIIYQSKKQEATKKLIDWDPNYHLFDQHQTISESKVSKV
uniref:Uncharacterized protein n=1 Tax=Rhizophora mucronata TaxID=61149 RepID=A0A2P2IKY3_RHIMU